MSGNAEQADRINISISKQNLLVDNDINPTRAVFEVNKINEVLKQPNEYEVQVKSFKIDTTDVVEFNSDGTSKYQLGIAILGGTDDNVYTSTFSDNTYQNPQGFCNSFNFNMSLAFTAAKAASGYTGVNAPILVYDSITERFVFYYDKALVTTPYSVRFFFSPAINSKINLPSRLNTTDNGYILLRQENTLFEKTVNGVSCYFVPSKGFPSNFSDIDEIIIQSSQIPVYDTFDDTQKDIRTSILKTIKYNYEDAIKGSIHVNYDNPDYYSIDSHYPIKQLDIQIFMKRKNGIVEPFILQQYDHFSLNLEFKKKQIF